MTSPAVRRESVTQEQLQATARQVLRLSAFFPPTFDDDVHAGFAAMPRTDMPDTAAFLQRLRDHARAAPLADRLFLKGRIALYRLTPEPIRRQRTETARAAALAREVLHARMSLTYAWFNIMLAAERMQQSGFDLDDHAMPIVKPYHLKRPWLQARQELLAPLQKNLPVGPDAIDRAYGGFHARLVDALSQQPIFIGRNCMIVTGRPGHRHVHVQSAPDL